MENNQQTDKERKSDARKSWRWAGLWL